MELTKEILEKKYREFIWIFLEKTTYHLIGLLRAMEDKGMSKGKDEVMKVNSTTKLIANRDNLNEISANFDLSKICIALDNYDKVIMCEILITELCINHSKILGDDIDSILLRLKPSEIKVKKGIHQEWGGSLWEIGFYIGEGLNEFIYCKEIGKYDMRFLFVIK